MKKAEMKLIRFDAKDIIATSVYLTLEGFNDKEKNNGTFSYEDTTNYSYDAEKDILALLKIASGATINKLNQFTFSNGTGTMNASNLINNDTKKNTTAVDYDGSYTWNGSQFVRDKQ